MDLRRKARYMVIAYGAAGLSFLSALIRDYIIVNYTDQGAYFFQLLYVGSMAAGFCVNAIILGTKNISLFPIISLYVIGLAVMVIVSPVDFLSLNTFALLASILLLWTAGAYWSRILIEQGNLFYGKSRELVASVAIALLVLAGLDIEGSFLLGVLLGTASCWGLYFLLRPIKTLSAEQLSRFGVKQLLLSVFFSNIATFAITGWALNQTVEDEIIFGISSAAAVRVSMYAYQALTIGAVVFIMKQNESFSRKSLLMVTLGAVLAFAISVATFVELALIVVPIASAIVHYCGVIYLQTRRIEITLAK